MEGREGRSEGYVGGKIMRLEKKDEGWERKREKGKE